MSAPQPTDPRDNDERDISDEVTEKTARPPAEPSEATTTTSGAAASSARDQAVVDLLDHFARHLTDGDAIKIADHVVATPATVVMEGSVTALLTHDDVINMFGSAKETYARHGIADTRADVVDIHWIRERIALVEVRFPWLDAAGDEIGGERSTYIVRRNDDDELRIQGVIMHGVEEGTAH